MRKLRVVKRVYCNEKMRNDFIENLMKITILDMLAAIGAVKILTLLGFDLSSLSGFLGLWTILCEVTDFPTIIARGPGSGISFGI